MPKSAPAVVTPASIAQPSPVAMARSIACLCYVNPKKPGSLSHARFQLYAQHDTVAAYVGACVASGQSRRNATADIAWDVKHGFIALNRPPVW